MKCSIMAIMGLLVCLGCAGNKQAAKPKDVPLQTVRSRANEAEREMEGGKTGVSQVENPISASAIVRKAPEGRIVVEIDTFRVFSDVITPREARAQTLQFVRELAIAKALPVDVKLSSLTTNMYVERNARFDESTAKSIYMMSSSAGRFISEDILAAEYSTRDYSYRMRYRAMIVPLDTAYNPSLELKVKLSNTLLRDGERFELEITPNSEGYLYIFDFLADNSVAMVFPTIGNPDNRLDKYGLWKRTMGAAADPDRDFCIETLYFVYSLEPIAGWEEFRSNRNANELVFSAGEESFIMFQKWLGKSDPARRIERLAQIHIFE